VAENTETKEETAVEEPGLARGVNLVDRSIGMVEQALLCLFMAILIGVACYQVVSGMIFDKAVPWSFEIIRNSVFLIAMTGAALSAQAEKMISMDFMTRVVKPKTKVYLRFVTRLFAIGTCICLIIGGWMVRTTGVSGEQYEVLKPSTVLLALPIGAGLIALHMLLHLIADAAYMAKGELPPETTEEAGS
jgi:TRAP-type C4-dicarboxylate transport system permease small subunit